MGLNRPRPDLALRKNVGLKFTLHLDLNFWRRSPTPDFVVGLARKSRGYIHKSVSNTLFSDFFLKPFHPPWTMLLSVILLADLVAPCAFSWFLLLIVLFHLGMLFKLMRSYQKEIAIVYVTFKGPRLVIFDNFL